MSEETGIDRTAGTESPVASVQSRHRNKFRPSRGGLHMIRRNRMFTGVHVVVAFAAVLLARAPHSLR